MCRAHAVRTFTVAHDLRKIHVINVRSQTIDTVSTRNRLAPGPAVEPGAGVMQKIAHRRSAHTLVHTKWFTSNFSIRILTTAGE